MDANEKNVLDALAASAAEVAVPASLTPETLKARLEALEVQEGEAEPRADGIAAGATPAGKDESAGVAPAGKDGGLPAITGAADAPGQPSTAARPAVRRSPRRRRWVPAAVAAALVLLAGVGLFAAGAAVLPGQGELAAEESAMMRAAVECPADDSLTAAARDDSSLVTSVPTADSYAQLYALLNAAHEDLEFGRGVEAAADDTATAKEAEGRAVAEVSMAADASSSTGASGNFSQTNLRTAGVDEADVVKTDGKVIYALQRSKGRVTLVKAEDGKMKKAAVIKAKELVDEKDDSVDFCEMFVADDRLYLIVNVYNEDFAGNTVTCLFTFDVSNPAKPKQVASVQQAGYYNSARMVDGYLYLFTDFYPSLGCKQDAVERYVPTVDGKALDCDDVYVPSCASGGDYLVVGSVKASEPDRLVQTKAVLSEASRVYVGTDSIYVYGTQRMTGDEATAKKDDSVSESPETDDVVAYAIADVAYYSDSTVICKLSFSEGKVEPVGETTVAGQVDSGFSIDEYEGNTRVITTSFSGDEETSNVFVLDAGLKKIGELTDLAPGERVYSVRMMGPIGYFVTYRQVDPLFSVDFSDPMNPKVIGALKIPGFSEYLHPWGEGKLLGIGMSTRTEDATEGAVTVTDGVKLSMFDTSDPANVRELHTFVLKNVYWSAALDDQRAVYVDAARGLVGFAAEGEHAVYYLFSYGKDGFSEKLDDRLEGWDSLDARGVRIDDVFYVVGADQVDSYAMDDFAKIDSVSI